MLELTELGRLCGHGADARSRDRASIAAGLPSTFVPGRNLLFFTYAAALAYRRGIRTLVGGMCETDYSGYPDCRNETLQTLAKAISLGMDAEFAIETPLMWIDKAATWALADKLGGAPLVELIVEDTHTCYLGIRSRRHPWGYGCGHCPACDLRAKGWDDMASRARRADPRRRLRSRRRLGDRARDRPAARGQCGRGLAARRAAQDRGRSRQQPLLVRMRCTYVR